ncbi:MAG: hypothetical protein ACK4SO_05000 [Candidatus Kapaibacteriota bacterium]
MVSKLKLLLVLVLCFSSSIFAKNNFNSLIIKNFELGYNFPINQISSSFFDAFNKYSKTSGSEFIFRNYPSLALCVEIPRIVEFILNIEWLRLVYSTDFGKSSTYYSTSFFRSYSENFDFNFFPVSLSFFYAPFRDEFHTLLHFQIGISFDRFTWKEFISSEFSDDPLIGVKIYELKNLTPFFCIGIRNVLSFDLLKSDQFLRELFLETKFYFFYRRVNLFYSISTMENIPNIVTILPFTIVFNLGVSLNTQSFFIN